MDIAPFLTVKASALADAYRAFIDRHSSQRPTGFFHHHKGAAFGKPKRARWRDAAPVGLFGADALLAPVATLNLHPIRRGLRYTLRGIYREEAEALRAVSRLEARDLEAVCFKTKAPAGSPAWFVAARHDVVERPRAGLPHRKSTEMEAVSIAVRVFRMQVRAAGRRGRTTRWYKHLDLARLRKLVGSYDWSGTRLDVASSMLSKTILAHPFPNTNHRTSLALTRTYLECTGVAWPRYSLRGQGANRFHRDTHGFFRSSKYWLQFVRRPEMVRTAFELGYTRLGIGPNTEAQIHGPDLALTPQQVEERHLAVCRRLLKDLASGEGRELLAVANSVRLKRWVEWFKQPTLGRNY